MNEKSPTVLVGTGLEGDAGGYVVEQLEGKYVLEIYEHHERVGRNLCWNCWERPAVTEWGSAAGHFADGGYCSAACCEQDAPVRTLRLLFGLLGASGDGRVELLRRLVDEVRNGI